MSFPEKILILKKGDVDFDIRLLGPIYQPIFIGNLEIADSEINIFKNNLKQINSSIQIYGDQVNIKKFSATGGEKVFLI